MDEFWKKLIAMGFDYDGVMERFLNSQDLMLNFLVKYFETDDTVKLERAIAAGDYGEAFEVAHLLKGVSGNLGLTPIYQEVSGIVQRIRQNEFSDLPVCLEKLKEYHLGFKSVISGR